MKEHEDSGGLTSQVAIAARVLAGVLLLDLISSWRYVTTLFRNPSADLVVVLTLFFLLMVGSLVGLALLREWGFYVTYPFLCASTILLGEPVVPGITRLLPTLELRIASVFIINVAFLAVVVWTHWMYRSTKQRNGELSAPMA